MKESDSVVTQWFASMCNTTLKMKASLKKITQQEEYLPKNMLKLSPTFFLYIKVFYDFRYAPNVNENAQTEHVFI